LIKRNVAEGGYSYLVSFTKEEVAQRHLQQVQSLHLFSDGMHPQMLRKLAEVIARQLSIIFESLGEWKRFLRIGSNQISLLS